MSTVTAQAIINKAVTQLVDAANVRWTRAELLAWLNDGVRQIVLMQPNATSSVESMKLVAGTRQKIPTTGWLLLTINRNMGLDGTTPGRAIRIISRQLMDGFDPNWHTATASDTTIHYIYDLQDQLAFYVYPPSKGNNYVELNYSIQPPDLTSETQVVPVFPIFQPALVDYVLYRAFSKDAEYAPGLALAQMYMTTFAAAVGGKEQTETKGTPEQAMLPRNPNVPGSTS